jgi:hypothetical protein
VRVEKYGLAALPTYFVESFFEGSIFVPVALKISPPASLNSLL